jgi:hypothetical protein
MPITSTVPPLPPVPKWPGGRQGTPLFKQLPLPPKPITNPVVVNANPTNRETMQALKQTNDNFILLAQGVTVSHLHLRPSFSNRPQRGEFFRKSGLFNEYNFNEIFSP